MLLSKSLLLFLLAGVDAATVQQCKGGLYADIASKVAKFAPAVQYCSQHFPVTAVTSTIVAATPTVVSTVSTATVT